MKTFHHSIYKFFNLLGSVVSAIVVEVLGAGRVQLFHLPAGKLKNL
jgi:hypothetical protein